MSEDGSVCSELSFICNIGHSLKRYHDAYALKQHLIKRHGCAEDVAHEIVQLALAHIGEQFMLMRGL